MIYNYNICVVLLYCKMSTSKNKVVLKPQLTFKNLMLMFLVRKTPYDDPEEDICPSLANCLQRDFTQA